MTELYALCEEMKQEMGMIKTSLQKLTDYHSKRLIEEWLRKDEAMRVLGISCRTLNRLLNSGKIPHSKVRGIVYIKTIDIEKLLKENFEKEMQLIAKKTKNEFRRKSTTPKTSN